VDVLAQALQVGADEVGGHVAGGGLGPGAQGDPGGLVVADLHGRASHQAAGFDRGVQVAQAVQGEGDVPLGGVGLPAVTGPVEQGRGLAAVVDALLVAGRGVEDDAQEVQGLALAPHVAQLGADAQGPLGVGPAPREPGEHGHDRGVLGVGLRHLGRRWVPLGQVHLPQVGPQAGHPAPLEPVDVRQPAVQAHRQQLGPGAVGRAPVQEQAGEQGVEQLDHDLPHDRDEVPGPAARHPPAQEAHGPLDRAAGGGHVAPLERQLAELALDLGPVDRIVGQPGCGLEVGRGLLVPAPEHEHVAEALGHLAPDPVAGAGRSPLGDAVLALGDLQGVPGAGPVGGGQRVGQGPGRVAGGVEVVGQLEDAVPPVGLERQRGLAVQSAAVVGGELVQQRLPYLVVDEGAVPAPGPQDVATSGLGHDGARLLGCLAAQGGGHGRVELLAQQRPHRQQPPGRRRQQLQAPGQEGGRVATGLDVGHGFGLDLPAGRLLDQGSCLDQAAEHGGGHERVAGGQPGHDLDGLVGEGAGHRHQDPAHVVVAQGRQDHVGRGTEPAQGVVGRGLLGPEGGQHHHPTTLTGTTATTGTARRRPVRRPVGHQLERQLVGPLAVVEDHQRRRLRLAQGVEEGGQRGQRTGLAVGLGPERPSARGAEQPGQPGKGVHHRVQL
jgi:hypothetical protein